jgi:shikimate kinase
MNTSINHISKYVVMCVGHTHTGKTTFGKKLIKEIPEATLIDGDTIASFLRKNYPVVVESSYNKSLKSFKRPNLKFLVWRDVYEFCLAVKKPIILSNGNLGKDIRSLIMKKAKENGYKVIMVYFNLSHDVILKRLQKTKKSSDRFVHSKNWSEVFVRQQEYAQLPPSRGETIFFELKDPVESERVLQEIVDLLK